MKAPPYIPAPDGLAANWAQNFADRLVAAPATYGTTAPVAATIAAAVTAFVDALAIATAPATRTTPTVAAKDAARVDMENAVRPLAQQIRANSAVTNQAKLDLGLNLPNTSPTPIPAPVTSPQLALDAAAPGVHLLRYADAGQGTGKAKPEGVVGIEIFRAVGLAPAVDPATCVYLGTFTKAPFRSTFGVPDAAKIATYFARWTTRSGPQGVAQTGPWSAPLSVVVV